MPQRSLPATFDVSADGIALGVLTVPPTGAPTFIAHTEAPEALAQSFASRVAAVASKPRIQYGYEKHTRHPSTGSYATVYCSHEAGRDDPTYASTLQHHLQASRLEGNRVRITATVAD